MRSTFVLNVQKHGEIAEKQNKTYNNYKRITEQQPIMTLK